MQQNTQMNRVQINKQVFWCLNNSSPFNWLVKRKARVSVISVNPGGCPEASSTRASPPTCVRELLPGCRSSCLPAARWRCRCGTWFPPWGLLLSPAAGSPVQSYLLVKNSWSVDVSVRLSVVAASVGSACRTPAPPPPPPCLRTCGRSQLQRRLRVVLHPVLERALHVGFGIQQQLQRWTGAWWEGEKEVGDSLNKSDVLSQDPDLLIPKNVFEYQNNLQSCKFTLNVNLLKFILQINLTF